MSLTRSQRAELERVIEERARALQEQIRGTKRQAREDAAPEGDGRAPDHVDQATASTEDEINHTLHSHYLGEMRQAEAARSRGERPARLLRRVRRGDRLCAAARTAARRALRGLPGAA